MKVELSGRFVIEIANLFYNNQILHRAQDDQVFGNVVNSSIVKLTIIANLSDKSDYKNRAHCNGLIMARQTTQVILTLNA